jgi:S-adenosylmethionine:tRNA ribosyltransferase-isomerase
LRVDDFDYELPAAAIASRPVEPRDAARLLVLDRGTGTVRHLHVRDLPGLLAAGDLLVGNDTRVRPWRLTGRRQSGGAVECLLLQLDGDRGEGLLQPSKRLRAGEQLAMADGAVLLRLEADLGGGRWRMTVAAPGTDQELGNGAAALLERHGRAPLPPYIDRGADDDPAFDLERYQTVFARVPGAVAAPTAGLHFTPELLDRLAGRGIRRANVELVVGLDTFQPISTADPRDHPMHTERYRVPPATMDAVGQARRVVAVGTTAVRALESAVARGRLEGRTDLFIHRGFDWQVVDLLMTNFHLPRTTLLMMIDAFVGARWRRLYATALASDYRFLSFGDAMLLDRRA